jgi:hypothetical protein
MRWLRTAPVASYTKYLQAMIDLRQVSRPERTLQAKVRVRRGFLRWACLDALERIAELCRHNRSHEAHPVN